MRHIASDRARLRDFMHDQQLDVKRLAERLDYNRESIYKFLSGERPATPTFRLKFATAFGFDKCREVFDDERVLA